MLGEILLQLCYRQFQEAPDFTADGDDMGGSIQNWNRAVVTVVGTIRSDEAVQKVSTGGRRAKSGKTRDRLGCSIHTWISAP